MSIIDNLLVLLDDGEKMTVEDIQQSFPYYSKQIISATLGRICSKNLIYKKSNKYAISPEGQNIITNNLNRIKIFEKRNIPKKIIFIMFNIPEKDRLYRDILRNYLSSHGYGRLHNTVWIGLNYNIAKFEKIIQDFPIKEKIFYFEISCNDHSLKNIIRHTNFNISKTNKLYKNYIIECSNYFKNKNKSKIFARCMVYNFSKIIANDPIIPIEYLDIKYKGLKALTMCQKIREYCY